MSTERSAEATAAGASWYRQPVVWLGAAVLAGSLIAMAATIFLAERYADEPLPVAGERVLKAPVARSAEPPATGSEDAAE